MTSKTCKNIIALVLATVLACAFMETAFAVPRLFMGN